MADQETKLTCRVVEDRDNDAVLDLIASNPIEMGDLYFNDRSPEFLRLHNKFEGSQASIVTDEAGEVLAVASAFRFTGRIGDEQRSYAYFTDAARDLKRRVKGTMPTLSASSAGVQLGTESRLGYSLTDAHNEAVRKFSQKIAASIGFEERTGLQAVIVIPVRNRRVGVEVGTPTRQELPSVLDYINAHYAEYSLFRPLQLDDFDPDGKLQYSLQDLLVLRKGGQLVGAALLDGPGGLSAIRLVKYVVTNPWLIRLSRWINTLTGLLAPVPDEGEIVPTLHIRMFAAAPEHADALFTACANLARERRVARMYWIEDERAPIPTAHGITFKSEVIWFGGFLGDSDVTIDELFTRPVFCDVALA